MTRATVTPLQALKRLIAVAKWPDAHWFNSAEDWNEFNAELAVAEMVVRDWVEPAAQSASQMKAAKYGCHIDLPEGHHDNCGNN